VDQKYSEKLSWMSSSFVRGQNTTRASSFHRRRKPLKLLGDYTMGAIFGNSKGLRKFDQDLAEAHRPLFVCVLLILPVL